MVTVEALSPLPRSEAQWRREVDRCRAEIADAERLLRNGHPDIVGLCLALSDWSAELRILEGKRERAFVSDSDPGNRAGVRTDCDLRQPSRIARC